MSFENKYLKYKKKYIDLKYKQIGGSDYNLKQGIKIKDTIITSLTGPVSFYYLKPNVDIEPSEIKYFPLIILFGDRHLSKEGSCANCYCSKEEGKCCYTISDHSFLQLLDTLGDTIHPIDFFTETFLAGTSRGFINGYMEDLTTKDMVTCYHRTLRGTEYNKCPTKNIRWQASDPRQAGDTFRKIERLGDDYYYYIHNDKTVKELLDENINGKRFINTISKKMRDNVYIELQFSKLIDKLYIIFQFLVSKEYELAIYIIGEFNEVLLKSEFKTLNNFVTLLQRGLF